MDALSIINVGTQPVDAVAPVKSMNRDNKQFGRVLSASQQTLQQDEAMPVDNVATLESEPVVARRNTTESEPQIIEPEELLTEAVSASMIQPEVASPLQIEIQQTLVELMNVMVQGDALVETEDSGSVEMLLTDLVQQLESAELDGEQVLAGVDLSVLSAELQSLDEGSDSGELLAELVAQVKEQLTNKSELLGNADLVAITIVDTLSQEALESANLAVPVMSQEALEIVDLAVPVMLQEVAPVIVENLEQARQLLQRAFDAVETQKAVGTQAVVAEANIAGAEQLPEEVVDAMAETAEEIVPHFAGLLQPRTGQHPAQQVQPETEQVSLRQARRQEGLERSEATIQAPPAEVPVQSQEVEVVFSSSRSAKQVLESLYQPSSHNLQSQGQPQAQGLETNKVMPSTPTVQLPSGQQIPESQICDQIVTHLSGSVNGESGRMVLRLQPAELGSLRLELKVEGDRIQANLHAQSHQVQEVLERNLPQLRHALAEQGLKIDQFQVNVDQRQQGGQFENLAQQQQNNSSENQSGWQQQNPEPEEQFIPLAHLMQNGGGGISLHV